MTVQREIDATIGSTPAAVPTSGLPTAEAA
jgi:hypothetical protein